MAFGLRELTFGASHHLKGFHRKLFNLPADFFLKRLDKTDPLVSSANITALIDLQTQKPRACRHCGYLLAEVTTKSGWKLAACSASELRNLLKAHELLEASSMQPTAVR